MKNTKLIQLILILCLFSVNLFSQSVSLGLVGDYSFSGNANDNSSFGNNGTVHGATLTSGQFGQVNGAYHFNGTSDYIQVNDAASLHLSGEMTLNIIYKLESFTTNPCQSNTLIQKWNGGAGFCLQFSDNGLDNNCNSLDTNLQVLYGIIGSSIWNVGLSYGKFIHTQTWYCATYIHSVDSEKIYIDGILKAAHATTILPGINTQSMYFGLNTNGVAAFNGVIDDIKIFNRALSSTEVSMLYQSTQCNGTQSATIASYGNRTFCEGSDVLLSVNNSILGAYQWKKNGGSIANATSRTYTAKVAGTYTCVVTNGCGVATSNAIVLTRLTNAANTISVSGSTVFCAGDSLMLNCSNSAVGYTYQWYRTNISINGATSVSYAAKNPGTYKVVTTNTGTGCSRISSNSIIAAVNCRLSNPARLSETIIPVKNLNVFPNPNDGSFTIDFTNEDMPDGQANIVIVDMLGKTVFTTSTEFAGGKLTQEINLPENFMNGLYLVNVSLDGENFSSKVLLQ